MKEECKLCSMNGWSGAHGTTDFSISSLMRPTPHLAGQPAPDPRHDAVLLSAYLLKLGYYQPAGPLIKEASPEERALARYHPPPHYHPPHGPMLSQYGPSYHPDLCYTGPYRHYRPPGPYYMPQPEAPMVGVPNDPYPPPPYYGSPCYQHSQRLPYVEYRGCSCPLNSCPKNVLIGPVTGKAPTGGGPADISSALAPPGGTFRAKVRACTLDAVGDTHGSGKDPPIEHQPPGAADVPRPCPLPAIGGASPKRELYDVRDNLRIAGNIRVSGEVPGPPSPARGSAGACPPQPPPAAPRRARLGKEMARRSLAGDDTGLLMSTSQPSSAHSDADDDVLAISPPLSAPIDLSSSDERSTPLVDIKKENEGPIIASARKTDTQALREHNSTTFSEVTSATDPTKGMKRRYSRSNLEIDMKDTQLDDVCRTNGIGEHVKLQKRRKVSGDQTEIPLAETITKEPKKKVIQTKRSAPKTPTTEKKTAKRKLENTVSASRAKKMLLDSPTEEERLKNVSTVSEESTTTKLKTKSVLALDNLLRKNSVDRADAKGYTSDTELNPAKLFLPSNENVAQNCAKRTLNINNNVVESANTGNGVRPNTIAAMSQLLGKKLAHKNTNTCTADKVDSKVTHSMKSVLKTPTTKPTLTEDRVSSNKNEIVTEKEKPIIVYDNISTKTEVYKENIENLHEVPITTDAEEDNKPNNANDNFITIDVPKAKTETVEPDESQRTLESKQGAVEVEDRKEEERDTTVKRCKMTNGELKGKNVEKVVKLLVSKRPAFKADEATLVVEEACASPTPSSGSRRSRRRRRGRRPAMLHAPISLEPRSAPRWSNGWTWEGEPYINKVYLNNDSRLDMIARCWSRMRHASGDHVMRGDCVLLRASTPRAQPFVARVASLWEHPSDGEMMVSLVWYYRPEHTERGRLPSDSPDEVFASRHRDANSVACIEDKCYVLTFNEYCRYRKRLKADEEGVKVSSIVPALDTRDLPPALLPNDSKLPPAVSPELVLYCRKVYDCRSKKIHVPNTK